jgi:glycerol kinase
VRAALESIAFIIGDVLRLMEAEAGITLQYIHADGGAVRNRFLMQRTADILQRTVRASRLPELSALGAAYNGFLGVGALSLNDIAATEGSFDEYFPAISSSELELLQAGWAHAVKQALV